MAPKILLTELEHEHKSNDPDVDELSRSTATLNRPILGQGQAYGNATIGIGPATVIATRVEEDNFIWEDDSLHAQLPSSVRLDIIISTVADTLSFSSMRKRSKWKRFFSDRYSKAVISDIFWWVFCNEFQDKQRTRGSRSISISTKDVRTESKREDVSSTSSRTSSNHKQNSEDLKDRLFTRISENYVKFFLLIPRNRQDAFFSRYYDAVAQVVYHSFDSAYPNSKSRFDRAFQEVIMNTCCKWLLGMKPHNYRISHWITPTSQNPRKTIANMTSPSDLSRAVRKAEINEDQQKQLKITLSGSAKQISKPKRESNLAHVHPNLVQTCYEVFHNPLVNHFLKEHGLGVKTATKLRFRISLTEDADNPAFYTKLKTSRIRRTRFGESGRNFLEDEYSLTPSEKNTKTYRDIIETSDSRRKDWMKNFKQGRAQLTTELKLVRKEARLKNKELDEAKKKAFRGDIHEFSNFLVSTNNMDI